MLPVIMRSCFAIWCGLMVGAALRGTLSDIDEFLIAAVAGYFFGRAVAGLVRDAVEATRRR